MRPLRDLMLLALRLAVLAAAAWPALPRAEGDAGGAAPLPGKLSETGLFAPGTVEIARDNLGYSPQYPLWSDGARKRRWIHLPPGTSIDAADPDAWQFPAGTRLWKEFAYGKAVETRYIERLPNGSWRFATYVWDADGRDARLAPAEGIPNVPVADAPGGAYVIPSRDDCLACHEGTSVPVLGVTALQLSPYRDALAPHAEAPGPEQVDAPGVHGDDPHGPASRPRPRHPAADADPDVQAHDGGGLDGSVRLPAIHPAGAERRAIPAPDAGIAARSCGTDAAIAGRARCALLPHGFNRYNRAAWGSCLRY